MWMIYHSHTFQKDIDVVVVVVALEWNEKVK